MLHQSKGTPIWFDQGAYSEDTFWEQIDGGRPWTPARKVFLIVPVILYVCSDCGTRPFPWRNVHPLRVAARFHAASWSQRTSRTTSSCSC